MWFQPSSGQLSVYPPLKHSYPLSASITVAIIVSPSKYAISLLRDRLLVGTGVGVAVGVSVGVLVADSVVKLHV